MSFILQNLQLFIFLALLVIGYITGTLVERRHYHSIKKREKQYGRILTFSEKTIPPLNGTIKHALVSGSVVISIDYFKMISAGLRSLLGGQVSAYESLLDRARREAILRMKYQAARKGMTMIFNVKMETASIGGGQRGGLGAVEVFAYGTAIRNELPKPAATHVAS